MIKGFKYHHDMDEEIEFTIYRAVTNLALQSKNNADINNFSDFLNEANVISLMSKFTSHNISVISDLFEFAWKSVFEETLDCYNCTNKRLIVSDVNIPDNLDILSIAELTLLCTSLCHEYICEFNKIKFEDIRLYNVIEKEKERYENTIKQIKILIKTMYISEKKNYGC